MDIHMSEEDSIKKRVERQLLNEELKLEERA